MQGVCVRHTDQCQPLCIPQTTMSGERPRVRVCSKGCNQLLQIPENKFAVCQAQKQVKCERAQEGDKCRAEKQVATKATCEYSAEMWEAGGTCIIDVLAKAQEVKLQESNGDLTKTAWGRRRKKAQGHHAKKTWGRRRKKAQGHPAKETWGRRREKAQGHHVKKAWVQYAKRLRAKAIA